MSSTYSPNLRVELIGTGDQAGTLVPIAKPRFDLAVLASDAPVPPSTTAKSEARDRVDKWSICTAMFVPSDQIETVLPAGTATPVPAAVVLPSTVEL